MSENYYRELSVGIMSENYLGIITENYHNYMDLVYNITWKSWDL